MKIIATFVITLALLAAADMRSAHAECGGIDPQSGMPQSCARASHNCTLRMGAGDSPFANADAGGLILLMGGAVAVRRFSRLRWPCSSRSQWEAILPDVLVDTCIERDGVLRCRWCHVRARLSR